MKRLLAYLFIVIGLGLTFNVSVKADDCVEGNCTNSVGKLIDENKINIYTGRFINNNFVAGTREIISGKYKGSVYVGKFTLYGSLTYGYKKIVQKSVSGQINVHEEFSGRKHSQSSEVFKRKIDKVVKEIYSVDLKKIKYACLIRGTIVKENYVIKIVDILKTRNLYTCEYKVYPENKILYNELTKIEPNTINENELAKIFKPLKQTQIAKAEPSKTYDAATWFTYNRWYKSNKRMTEYANEVHVKLKNKGYCKGTKCKTIYFTILDTEMRKKFPSYNFRKSKFIEILQEEKTQIAKAEPSQTQKVAKKEKKKSKWITKKTTTEDKTIKSKTNKVLGQEKAKITTDKRDNDAPILIVDENITVNSSSYSFIVKAKDKGSEKIFIQVDGVTSEFKDGIFKIDRFSPVNEKITIVAIDQWGNKSKAKTVNIKVDIKDTIVAKKIEKLNPSKLKVKKSRNKVALIIGIEDYSQSPNATFANLDAKYFYEYASKGFGVKKENIKLMIDKEATLIKSIGVLSKWLPSRIKSGETELIIFFAGHGLASNDGKDLFLLSQDSDPDLLARTALSRTELFKEIIKLNPKSVTMFLDTCYSGVSRDEKTLLASARPVRIIANEQDTPDNFTIFSASQLDQISSGLKDAKHGIFSYYLMKGLEGKADLNKDRNITNGELLAYMDENVAQKASELGRQQNPSLSGNENKILLKY